MHAQTQSTFCTGLPAEIRSQIQIHYLGEHLRAAAIQGPRDRHNPTQLDDVDVSTHRFSTPPSPLSLSCKLMRREMRDSSGPTTPGSLAVFCVAPNREFGETTMGLAAEGHFTWQRVRRLLFFNELGHPEAGSWLFPLADIIKAASDLTTLEMEWNPRMHVIRGLFARKIMRQIAEHPSLHVIRIRGNVPRPWVREMAAMPGKKVVVEDMLWEVRDPEGERKLEMEEERRVFEIQGAQKEQLHEFHMQDLKRTLDGVAEQEGLGQRRSRLMICSNCSVL